MNFVSGTHSTLHKKLGKSLKRTKYSQKPNLSYVITFSSPSKLV